MANWGSFSKSTNNRLSTVLLRYNDLKSSPTEKLELQTMKIKVIIHKEETQILLFGYLYFLVF
jgi:hypothetical protein